MLENNIKKNNDNVEIRLDYVEKRETDRPTLYSFNGLFQLLHADITNLEFLEKSASVPNYAFLFIDLYSSKVYFYPMRSRKQIHKKLEQFYIDVKNKRKNRHTRLQVDNEFQQVGVKDLNDKFNLTMFTTCLRGRKAFAAEQKIRELKSGISKLRAISDKQKVKIPAVTIIKQSAENTNNVKSVYSVYSISPNIIEEKSLSSQRFRALFNFKRIEKSKNVSDRLEKYSRKKYAAKKKKICNSLEIGEKVFVLVERIKKNQHLENFIETVQDIPYFNKKNSVYNKKKAKHRQKKLLLAKK